MISRFVMTGFVVLMSYTSVFASKQIPQGSGSHMRQPISYSSQWKQVDSLSNQGLPKSALTIVNKIYEQAKKEKNDPQYIKAVIYKLKLKADFREETIPTSIKEVNAEIKESKESARQILYSIEGELYQSYYQNNRYLFDNRTELQNNPSDSIQTWDLKTLNRKTLRTYLLSLQDPDLLKTIPIGDFGDILVKPGPEEKQPAKMKANDKSSYRPTLYDFLCWRVLDYLAVNRDQDKVVVQPFSLDQASYFGQAREFAVQTLELPLDSSSFLAFSLKIYQDLAAFHSNDKDPRALINEEILRFQFLKENSFINDKDSLYLDGLKKLEQSSLSSPYSTDVTYAIAAFLKEQGTLYHPTESQKHKRDLKEAADNCNQAIKRFPESHGAANCRLILADIESPALQVETEHAVVPEKPSLGLITFRNLKSLYFRVVKSDPDADHEKTMNRSREEKIAWYTSLTFQKSWSLDLPNDGDYQSHGMEFKIPELPVGYYILIASSDVDFKDTNQVIAWTPFYSSHLSYISQRNEKSEENFYILDRETGVPLKGIAAEAFRSVYNYTTHKIENQKAGDYTTDENGYFSLPAVITNGTLNNVYLRLRSGDDFLVTGNYYRYPVYEPNEKTTLETFFFTDRGIYRPGQTVYFKGVVVEKKGDQHNIKPGIQTTVTFTDVNNQKIATQTYTTNDFGSFNGTFIIPQGILTGEMTLTNGSGEITFSVEEYKRPTFQVTFNPVEGNYHLNDSVAITGKALAYAGNNISSASVKYRVVRSVRFPFLQRGWWMPFPSIPETEIGQGIH